MSDPAVYRFPLIPFSHICVRRETRYLVKELLPREGLILVWGEPKCCKSFWALDVSLHIAAGIPYRGMRTKAGTVVYIACEGEHGLAARITAAQAHLAITSASFYLLPTHLDLAKETPKLVDEINKQSVTPALVVIDTLNRTLRGSESSDQDMAAYIKAADTIRKRFSCAVLLIHHCGHDHGRPRGHSSLIGAVDAQIAVKRDRKGDGLVTTKVELMKDGPEGATTVSRLEQVGLGADSDGDPITSCALTPLDSSECHAEGKPSHLTKAARIALEALSTALDASGKPPPANLGLPDFVQRVVDDGEWRITAYRAGISRGAERGKQRAFKRAKEELMRAEMVGISGGVAWLILGDANMRTPL